MSARTLTVRLTQQQYDALFEAILDHRMSLQDNNRSTVALDNAEEALMEAWRAHDRKRR